MPRRTRKPVVRHLLTGAAAAALLAAQTPAAGATLGSGSGAAPPAANSPAELTQLATQYEHGEGVEQSYEQAIKLYCAAALEDHAPAQHALGWIYANGRGVNQDEPLAAAWFARAAELGDGLSKRLLARMGGASEGHRAACVLPDGARWAPIPPSVPNPDRSMIVRWVEHFAPKYELDVNLVLAVIKAESNFNAQARSHKNAQGLMQLIPATARRFGVKNTFDPVDNIQGGMAYLQWLLRHFEGNVKLALAGYNAGEGAVQRYSGVPPYPETRAYVRKILRDVKRES